MSNCDQAFQVTLGNLADEILVQIDEEFFGSLWHILAQLFWEGRGTKQGCQLGEKGDKKVTKPCRNMMKSDQNVGHFFGLTY
jgi:hypothetical protein